MSDAVSPTSRGASAASTAALAVSFGAHPVDELEALRPLAVLHDVPSLHAWLTTHG